MLLKKLKVKTSYIVKKNEKMDIKTPKKKSTPVTLQLQ